MKEIKEDFIKLIQDKTKSAEEIYEIMYQNHKENFSTRRIFRGLKSWDCCLYQGTIGENDFFVDGANISSLTIYNTEMIYDDYKESMIRFIELFREEYEKDPSRHVINIMISISQKYLADLFPGASRSGDAATIQRKEVSIFDETKQQFKYNISSQKGEGRAAVCSEKNVTIGNAFQFMGYETYQMSGTLYSRKDDKINEGHAFVLLKYGSNPGTYALFDMFNNVYVKKALPGDYDLTKGFEIEDDSKTLVYRVNEPLYEMTDEAQRTEAIIRNLTERYEAIKRNYVKNMDVEGNLGFEPIKSEFLNLMDVIEKSNMNDIFKKRYINVLQVYIDEIKEIEDKYINPSSTPRGF